MRLAGPGSREIRPDLALEMRAGRRQRQAELEGRVREPGAQLAHGFFRQRRGRLHFGARFKVVDSR
jgi:hypothetical protein